MWFDVPHRPTRDIDLLDFGFAEEPLVHQTFRGIFGIACDDGVMFDASSIRVAEIRKEANYSGLRVTLIGHLDGARCSVQIDIGYGDAVTPAPELADHPVMLEGLLSPRIRTDRVTRGGRKVRGHRVAGHGQQPTQGLLRPLGSAHHPGL
ncbi:MAG: nucleotidyl transferase AbiEii/AbiGii toxin family protein [Limnohabitans sp.]